MPKPATSKVLEFPIPEDLQPPRLKALLSKEATTSPAKQVSVCERFEVNAYKPNYEAYHTTMAAVRSENVTDFGLPRESSSGLVSYSSLDANEKGQARSHSPSISGEEYLVASWGTGSYYGFCLADKVWMSLGLSPRSIGADEQKIVFDDLQLPLFGVAQGQVSNEYYYKQKGNVKWSIRNDYLRNYLWMKDFVGVRVFFYEANIPKSAEWLKIQKELTDRHFDNKTCWFDCKVIDFKDGLRLQIWAAPVIVDNELCLKQNIEEFIWPGDTEPMTKARAESIMTRDSVYIKDSFLKRYEQNGLFESTPVKVYDSSWYCSPSYGGQWSFTDCRRVGRNLIKVPIRELYKPKPQEEIIHAYHNAISETEALSYDLNQEHIVQKTERFLESFLRLADALSLLSSHLDLDISSSAISGYERDEIIANGWQSYPLLHRLAAVAPLEMTEQEFLSRCKLLNEAIQVIPNRAIKNILAKMGAIKGDYVDLGLLKLLQALYTIGLSLNKNGEDVSVLFTAAVETDLAVRQKTMAPLFINNELRNLDAHAGTSNVQSLLTELGHDVALLNDGYGLAIDKVFDCVIANLDKISTEFEVLFLM